ncbi:MAG TPA: hypothetical protein VGK10_18645 [Prolixibacteraceae bacterium]
MLIAMGATHGQWCNPWSVVQPMVSGATHGQWWQPMVSGGNP